MIAMERNPDWYAAKYNIAALHINWMEDFPQVNPTGPDERTVHRDAAREQARELALAAIEQLTSQARFRGRAELRALLREEILPHALLIFAGGCSDQGDAGVSPKSDRALRAQLRSKTLSGAAAMAYVEAKAKPTLDTHARLACAHAHRGEFAAAIRRLELALKAAFGVTAKGEFAAEVLAEPTFKRLLEEQDDATTSLHGTLRNAVEAAAAKEKESRAREVSKTQKEGDSAVGASAPASKQSG